MCTFTWCTLNMVQWLAWRCLCESKHVATLIDNKLVVFWLNLMFEYFSENTSWWLKLKRKFNRFVIERSEHREKLTQQNLTSWNTGVLTGFWGCFVSICVPVFLEVVCEHYHQLGLNYIHSRINAWQIWTFNKVCFYPTNIPPKKLRGLSPERTIPTERPPPVGEVSANFCG